MTTLVDDLPSSAGDCTDFSIINRGLYDRDIVMNLDDETKKFLINTYLNAVGAGATLPA